MRHLFAIFLTTTVLSSMGCALTSSQISEEKYLETKQKLERDIEILRLERRKLIIQTSIDQIDKIAKEELTEAPE